MHVKIILNLQTSPELSIEYIYNNISCVMFYDNERSKALIYLSKTQRNGKTM